MLLARIDAVNPALNSVIELRREAALQEAGAADQAIAGGVRKPLHGVPMTIKESFNVAGMHTTWGNPAFMDYMADSDATVVRRLKQAGAIIVGKTNVHFMLADFGQAVRCHQQSLGYDTHPGRLHRWSGCGGLCRDDVPRIRLGPKTTPLSRSPTSSVTSSVGTSPRRSDESEGRSRAGAAYPRRPLHLKRTPWGAGYRIGPVVEAAPFRSGGKSARSPSASTWKSAWAWSRPGKRYRPRLRKLTPAGKGPSTAALVSPETTIWPPWAVQQTRAPAWTDRPIYPVSVRVGRPLWIPTRTRH